MELTVASAGGPARHRVVVVGGGFAGLRAVRGLRRVPVDVTLIDRRNFHLFQPLLYQVAAGALTAGEIATPLRGILKRQANASVVLGEVVGVDLERRQVALTPADDPDAAGAPSTVDYDTLVVATGVGHAYFGHDQWQEWAPGLKTLEDALDIRRRILGAFEAAELTDDPQRRRELLTFVVVGGGPTGVEMAGQVAEIAHDTLRHEFRRIDPDDTSVLLVEAADRVLTTFPATLSAHAVTALRRLGVTALLDHVVTDLDGESVTVRGSGRARRIPTRTVIWAAGMRAAPLADVLAAAGGAPTDAAGRICVGPDLTLPGHPEVFVLGDMAGVHDVDGRARSLPGVAPVAMQAGRHAAATIRARLAGRPERPFRYVDKGNVATVGRLAAVADLRGLHLHGALAWLTYLLVHLFYLLGLQNRALVLLRWTVSFVTRGRGARLITGSGRPRARAGGEAVRERQAS